MSGFVTACIYEAVVDHQISMGGVAGCLILIVSLMSIVEGRILRLNSWEDELISDGMDGQDWSVSGCHHQYGFLPCAENAAGYIYQIVVYQVLLVVGDMLMDKGSEVLFHIIGAEFGGILFRILRVLPSMVLVIFSGILSDKENAQSQVSVGVGIYAGITVFSLTVQWFIRMVSASKSFKEGSGEKEETSRSNCSLTNGKLWIFIENGVEVDKKTCKTAKVMLLSLIPYIVLQLVHAFDNSSGKRIITLIALTVSSLSLISYFVYQIRDPWMQKRSLQSLDDDEAITVEELEDLVRELLEAGKNNLDQNEEMNKILNELGKNHDGRISEDEFVDQFIKWIREAQHSASTNNFNPTEMSHKAFQLPKEKKKDNFADIDKIMSKILKQAEGQLMKSEALVTENWEPNIERIQCLFREFDADGNGSLSAIELKQLIGRVKFETYHMKDAYVIKEMFRVFDPHGNEVITEKEFIKGVQGYLEKAVEAVNTLDRTIVVEEYDKMVWKEQVWGMKALFKSVVQVLLGIAMLTILARPLIGNILDLSNAMNLPSFLISFVVVPLAMNGRAAIAALLRPSKKRKRDSSLTFSEIYGGVIMNNMAGLTTLLAIVYAKELAWDFTAEVLTILVVCGTIGTLAFLSTTYQLWTCILAFLLYPISVGLFYFVQVFYSWN